MLILLASCDPALVALFTPAHPRLGRYEVCASEAPLEPVGGGPVEALEALDAFGAAGTYDRPKLSRLYGGTRVQVARGRIDGSGQVESRTYISPHPDVRLEHLVPGTLIIRFIICCT